MTMSQDDLFGSLFKHRDRRIDRMGNPLLAIEAHAAPESIRVIQL